jgi:hypothetical protein
LFDKYGRPRRFISGHNSALLIMATIDGAKVRADALAVMRERGFLVGLAS